MPEQEALSVSEVLSRAADLIKDQKNWTQHFTARGPIVIDGIIPDPNKEACCLATDFQARQWSALGAIFKVGRKAKMSCASLYEIERKFCDFVGARRMSDWNATTEHKKVVSALRAAAEASQ